MARLPPRSNAARATAGPGPRAAAPQQASRGTGPQTIRAAERVDAYGTERIAPWSQESAGYVRWRDEDVVLFDGTPSTRRVRVSLYWEWIRRGGGSSMLPPGEEFEDGPLAALGRDMGRTANLVYSNANTAYDMEMCWARYEQFVRFMMRDTNEWKQQLVELDRILYGTRLPNDPKPEDWRPKHRIPQQHLLMFMVVLRAEGDNHEGTKFESRATKHMGVPVMGRKVLGCTLKKYMGALRTLEGKLFPGHVSEADSHPVKEAYR